MTDQELQNLKRDVEELKEWKKARMAQQIVYPLDAPSYTILNDKFMSIIESVTYEGGVGGNTFTFYIGKQGGLEFEAYPVSSVPYYVDPATNLVYTTSPLKFFDDQPVILISTGTAPAPLVANLGTTYYVINSDGHIFELSATLGGAAINITDTGSGRQFMQYG